ncbi:hypothetical protein SAMN05421678_101325 [Actinopolymorpha cephalotaxi]|uniref:Uncharacterized protein n=1 Tax=Actinopolymorpha cephalotaxi TaxID=504797 RepID=A0A1I2KN16_9ACTN|nr:hypothetical protein [Actinopolymorpha cephalotaxi]NYH84467.1 hypothetical protein [Actinopolymorpha cephalotaxi]SFF66617.1 hypothetical protein SAMN05421678_101325 [Actinopolymorpha cephalotaxi]
MAVPVLCVLVVLTFLAARPPAPLPAGAPAGEFGAGRAHAYVRTLAREPHATGTAANRRRVGDRDVR